MNKGYIVKFYKKIRNVAGINKKFDFISFMNFDGIKIKEVDNFKDFQQKSIDYINPSSEDSNCIRQKLLLYSLENNYNNLSNDEYIFDHDEKSNFSKEMPILIICIVNLKHDIAFDDENFENLVAFINTYAKQKIKFEIFGTLSANDFVIAIRCKSFSDFFLFSYGGWLKRTDLLHSIYTIPSIFLSKGIKLSKERNLMFSMRSTLSPAKINLKIDKNGVSKINDRIIRGITETKGYHTFGKYDLEIRGYFKDNIDFLSNFDIESKDFKLHSNEVPMRPTNTRFLYKIGNVLISSIPFIKPFEYWKTTDKKDRISCDEVDKNFLRKIDDITDTVKPLVFESVSSNTNTAIDFKQNFTRLWLRAYQLLIRSRNKPTFYNIYDTIKTYYTIVSKHITDATCYDSMIYGLQALNTMIDNWDLNDFQEFENPHSNLMFSGCCTGLLSAYFKMTTKLFKYIQILNYDTDKEYCSFITADGYSEVSVIKLFENVENFAIINIRTPMEMLYDINSTVCLVSHELGHFWKYEPKEIDELINHISNISFLGNSYFELDENSRKNVVKKTKEYVLGITSEYDSIADFKYSIKEYLSKKADSYSGNYKDWLNEQCNHYIKLLYMVMEATDEAVADIFMLNLLKIDADDYLNVVVEYFKYKNIPVVATDENSNMDSVLVRIISVLLCFVDENESELGKLKDKLLILISAYSVGKDKYTQNFCECLEFFLNSPESCAIEKRVNEKTYLSICLKRILLQDARKKYNIAFSLVDESTKNSILEIQNRFSNIIKDKENTFEHITNFITYLNNL